MKREILAFVFGSFVLASCASPDKVTHRSLSENYTRLPAQENGLETNYECDVVVVGATNTADHLFLKLLWIPPFPGHPGHASPSRKSIWMGTQQVSSQSRLPKDRANTPVEKFVSDKVEPTSHEPWSNVFPEFYFRVTSSNFGLAQPPKAYTLSDFAMFEDDSDDGNGGPSGVRYEFSASGASSSYSMKFTQFIGGLASGKIDYQFTGTCKPAE